MKVFYLFHSCTNYNKNFMMNKFPMPMDLKFCNTEILALIENIHHSLFPIKGGSLTKFAFLGLSKSMRGPSWWTFLMGSI